MFGYNTKRKLQRKTVISPYKRLSDGFSGSPIEQLISALAFLEIDEQEFRRIHTPGLKKERLLYKFLKKEFELAKQHADHQLQQELLDKSAKLAEQAYQIILESSLTTDHTSEYNAASVGLSELDIRKLYKTEIKAEIEAALSQSIYAIGNKDEGSEPGFKALEIKDIFLSLYNDYPDQQKRLEFLASQNVDIKNLHHFFAEKLPKYLVKLTYDEITQDGKIKPPLESLKQTQAVQNAYKKNETLGNIYTLVYQYAKTGSSADKNVEAVLEVLANDLARIYGMVVQKQVIYPSLYKNEFLQLMLKANWVDGASTLQPLAGGEKNDNYRVKPVIIQKNKIQYLSDNSIEHLAEYLPLFALIADRDAIGSLGQNKLCVDNTMVGIDFGHAFQKWILDSLTTDFQINDAEFKNYSVFYDYPRSDDIRGLIRIARLNGDKIDESILRSYGDEFYDEIQQIVPLADEQIYDDYIKKFTEFAKEFSESTEAHKNNKKCIEYIIAAVTKQKATLIKARKNILEKFSHYLKVEKNAVDLVANMEKLLAGRENTSLRSSNETVLLNHLRITHKNILKWDINVDADGKHTLAASFSSSSAAAKANTILEDWLQNNKSPKFKLKNNIIEFSFEKHELDSVYELFNENEIKLLYHANDYKLYQHYLNEEKFTKTLATLDEYGIIADLKATSETSYKLVIRKCTDKPVDTRFFALLQETLKITENDGELSITFDADELNSIHDDLNYVPKKFQAEIRQELEVQKQLDKIHKIQTIWQNEFKSTSDFFSLERDAAQHCFILNINKNTSQHLFFQQLKEQLESIERTDKNSEYYIVTDDQLSTLYDVLIKAHEIYKNVCAEQEQEKLRIMEEAKRQKEKEEAEELQQELTNIINQEMTDLALKKQQKRERDTKIEMDNQLNRFAIIQSEILSDKDKLLSKLTLGRNDQSSTFIFTIASDHDEPIFNAQITEKLATFEKNTNGSYLIPDKDLHILNSILCNYYERYDLNRAATLAHIQKNCELLIETISSLNKDLIRTPSSTLAFLKYPYNFYINMAPTAVQMKQVFATFLDSADMLTLENINKLQPLLLNRKKHITNLNKASYETEKNLLDKALGAITFLNEFSPEISSSVMQTRNKIAPK